MRKYEKASKGEMASAMKKIIEYMKGSVGIVAVALVLAALGAVLTIIGPDKVGEITDLIADGLMTGIDLKAVAREFSLERYIFQARCSHSFSSI